MTEPTQQKPTDAWSYAKELVARVVPSFLRGERGSLSVPGFEYRGDDIHGTRSFRFCREGEQDRGSYVVFDLYRRGENDHLDSLRYWEGNVRHSLFASGISQYDAREDVYPRFSWCYWLGEYNHLDDSRLNGRLSILTVYLAGNTVVVYDHQRNGNLEVTKREGQADLLGKVPASLKDVDTLLGIPVPKQIDYDARAWDIVRKSGLESFVEAVERERGHITIP